MVLGHPFQQLEQKVHFIRVLVRLPMLADRKRPHAPVLAQIRLAVRILDHVRRLIANFLSGQCCAKASSNLPA